MKILFAILFLLIGSFSFSQRVNSDCTAHDSIIKMYQGDADQLALQRLFRQQSRYIEEIEIPKTYSDTVMRALLAVHNVKTIPQKDTVILLNIHYYHYQSLNEFSLRVDTSIIWAKNLNNNIIPCNQTSIDYYLQKYELKIKPISQYLKYYYINFISSKNYNFHSATNDISLNSEVDFCRLKYLAGDGDRITDSIYDDHVELIYSHGWGDCTVGCINRRYWKFNVYFDCSVEFVESYGSHFSLGIDKNANKTIKVSPNPFSESISIKGAPTNFRYSITNLLGQECLKGQSITGSISDLDQLKSGFYLLTIQYDNSFSTIKIVKH